MTVIAYFAMSEWVKIYMGDSYLIFDLKNGENAPTIPLASSLLPGSQTHSFNVLISVLHCFINPCIP